MPMDRSLYPDNWEEISYKIRSQRAKWRCEQCGAIAFEPHPLTGSRVILTVHHIGVARPDGSPGDYKDKMDCRDENLIALCQDCHLRVHRFLRRKEKRQRQLLSGQLEMFPREEIEAT